MRLTPTLRQAVVPRHRTLAWIGLGQMGFNMASNLLTKTFDADSPSTESAFVVHDAVPAAVERFLDEHAEAASRGRVRGAEGGAEEIPHYASTIFTMLPSTPQVKSLYYTSLLPSLSQIHNSASPPTQPTTTTFIDCTTLDVPFSRALSSDLRKIQGVDFLDAPVSGGVVGAKAGTLAFMVGAAGGEESFGRVRGMLERMGGRVVLCGGAGSGLAAKIVNNLVLAQHMLAVSEGMLLGKRLGLPPAVLASVINTSTGKCWSSEINNPCPGALPSAVPPPPADRDYAGGFAAKLMNKDIHLALDAARAASEPVRLEGGELAARMYERVVGEGEGEKDFGVLFRVLEREGAEQ